MELVQFVFQDFTHWLGALILFPVVIGAAASAIAATVRMFK